jgi:GNAT superfamily N-acetyltransferase
LRAFSPQDLPALVEFWNTAFADQRNFQPLTAETFRQRILACPAFETGGLILAWEEGCAHTNSGRTQQDERTLVGMVHALRPMAPRGVYARWGAQPGIAVLYVRPESRRRGIGSRLLQAAENWLYYCPVYLGAPGQACYGAVEGPRPPLFGTTQALALNAHDTETIRFFAQRGYRPYEPGDVSMRLVFSRPPAPPATAPLPARLRLIEASHTSPFQGQEPPGREEYTLWGDNDGDPYTALILVDGAQRLHGHISWYAMARPEHAAIASFWLAPHLRGRKLGALLLDAALHRIYCAPAPSGGYRAVEVHTHTVRHPTATRLYESRGFQLEAAWAALVKT